MFTTLLVSSRLTKREESGINSNKRPKKNLFSLLIKGHVIFACPENKNKRKSPSKGYLSSNIFSSVSFVPATYPTSIPIPNATAIFLALSIFSCCSFLISLNFFIITSPFKSLFLSHNRTCNIRAKRKGIVSPFLTI